MLIKDFFLYYNKLAQVLVGEILLNTETIFVSLNLLKEQKKIEKDLLKRFESDIKALIQTLSEIQLGLKDIEIILTNDDSGAKKKISLDQFKIFQEKLEEAIQIIEREITFSQPLLPRGHKVSLLFFHLATVLELEVKLGEALREEKDLFSREVEVIISYLETIKRFSYLMFRWFNLFLLRKEFKWKGKRFESPQKII